MVPAVERVCSAARGAGSGSDDMDANKPDTQPSGKNPNGRNSAPDAPDRPLTPIGYVAGGPPPSTELEQRPAAPEPPEPAAHEEQKQLRGSHPGDRYVRVARHTPVTLPG